MHMSRPIEIHGRFLGVAVTHVAEQGGKGWRFVATDPLLEDLDGATFASPAEVQRVAGLVFARSSGRPTAGVSR